MSSTTSIQKKTILLLLLGVMITPIYSFINQLEKDAKHKVKMIPKSNGPKYKKNLKSYLKQRKRADKELHKIRWNHKEGGRAQYNEYKNLQFAGKAKPLSKLFKGKRGRDVFWQIERAVGKRRKARRQYSHNLQKYYSHFVNPLHHRYIRIKSLSKNKYFAVRYSEGAWRLVADTDNPDDPATHLIAILPNPKYKGYAKKAHMDIPKHGHIANTAMSDIEKNRKDQSASKWRDARRKRVHQIQNDLRKLSTKFVKKYWFDQNILITAPITDYRYLYRAEKDNDNIKKGEIRFNKKTAPNPFNKNRRPLEPYWKIHNPNENLSKCFLNATTTYIKYQAKGFKALGASTPDFKVLKLGIGFAKKDQTVGPKNEADGSWQVISAKKPVAALVKKAEKIAIEIVDNEIVGFEKKPGALTFIAVADANNVWGIDADRNVFKWAEKKWDPAKIKFDEIALGTDNAIWGLKKEKTNDTILTQKQGQWVSVKPPPLKGEERIAHIALADKGTGWITTTEQRIYRWWNNSWRPYQGSMSQISTGSDDTVWALNNNNEVFQLIDTKWTKMPGKLKCIAVGGPFDTWGISPYNEILRWDGTTWIKQRGKLNGIAVGKDGTAWGCTFNDDVYHKAAEEIIEISFQETLKEVELALADKTALNAGQEQNTWLKKLQFLLTRPEAKWGETKESIEAIIKTIKEKHLESFTGGASNLLQKLITKAEEKIDYTKPDAYAELATKAYESIKEQTNTESPTTATMWFKQIEMLSTHKAGQPRVNLSLLSRLLDEIKTIQKYPIMVKRYKAMGIDIDALNALVDKTEKLSAELPSEYESKFNAGLDAETLTQTMELYKQGLAMINEKLTFTERQKIISKHIPLLIDKILKDKSIQNLDSLKPVQEFLTTFRETMKKEMLRTQRKKIDTAFDEAMSKLKNHIKTLELTRPLKSEEFKQKVLDLETAVTTDAINQSKETRKDFIDNLRHLILQSDKQPVESLTILDRLIKQINKDYLAWTEWTEKFTNDNLLAPLKITLKQGENILVDKAPAQTTPPLPIKPATTTEPTPPA